MKRSRFSEQQIAFILRQAEEGKTVEEVCRKAGIMAAIEDGMYTPALSTVLPLAFSSGESILRSPALKIVLQHNLAGN